MKTSVALCTYNGEKFLGQQIDSILNQTVAVDEIVVCDDGSTDQTIPILNQYLAKYPDIFKIYRNEKNLRSVKNFEKAISLCSNDVIFLSDQDDLWLPEKVESYLHYFSRHPHVNVLCSNGYGIDENNEVLDVIAVWDLPKLIEEKEGSFDYFATLAFMSNFATGAAMAIRKNFLPEVIPFPIIKDFHHDEWIALVAAEKGKFGFLHEKLFKYREHSAQQVGGVFYENSERTRNGLISFLAFNNKKNSNFKYYKKILKRMSSAYKKHTALSEQCTTQKKIFENIAAQAQQKYIELRKEAKRKYPLSFTALRIADHFSKKRKL